MEHEEQRKYIDLGSDDLNVIKIQITNAFVVLGDVMIRVSHNGIISDKFMFRFAFNTAFIPEDKYILVL